MENKEEIKCSGMHLNLIFNVWKIVLMLSIYSFYYLQKKEFSLENFLQARTHNLQ